MRAMFSKSLDVLDVVSKVSRISRELGWSPQLDMEEGLNRVWAWLEQ